jgi:predicted nuclease of predicted toxin-antitoxin system
MQAGWLLQLDVSVKLLLDENLSYRLVASLQDAFPGTSHVTAEGLSSANDLEVWEFAGKNGFVIVSKDEDFSALSALRGHPPKLIKLSLGNCSNAEALHALVQQSSLLIHQLRSEQTASVELVS